MQIQSMGNHSVKDNYGLIKFVQPAPLTQKQIKMAKGYKEILTIDWGDYQRQEWHLLSSKIKQIDAKILMLRNNRYPAILKELCLIQFPHLIQINVSSNKLVSLQSLQKFNLPNLKELDLRQNFIVSTRSLAKAFFPMLNIVRLQTNPLVDNSRLFQGLFPKLGQLSMDQSFSQNLVHSSSFSTDPVTWRVKNAPKLSGDIKMRKSRYVVRYDPSSSDEEIQTQSLNFVKYYQMLENKPNYFNEHSKYN